MKRACFVLAWVLFVSTMAYAELKVIVQGDSLSIDPSGFPPKMQAAYGMMLQKCNKCHSIERVIVAVQSGVCPVSKTSFSKDTAASVVTRMYLKPDSNMTKKEARTILDLIYYMLEQKTTVVEKK
jgi:hypothetical protein